MEKIKIIADSSCDITKQSAKDKNISIAPILIVTQDNQYRDWYDFEPEEFYYNLYKWDPLPTTSQVVPAVWEAEFIKSVSEGYNKIIVVTLNSRASGGYQSALIAKDMFLETNSNVEIEVIDSTSYSYLIGLYLEKVSVMIKNGTTFREAVTYLKEKYSKVEAFAVVCTLDFLKRGGRISGATSVIGNLLDIKPILKIGDCQLIAYDKVRGRKKSVTKMISLVKENIDPNEKEICIIVGDMIEELDELKTMLDDVFPGFTIHFARLGSVISIHSGPKLLGISFLKKEV